MSPASRILGTGHYLPEVVRTNADLEKMVDTTDQWIFDRTGIRERHVAAEGEVTSDMALKASIRAMEMARTRPEELDLIKRILQSILCQREISKMADERCKNTPMLFAECGFDLCCCGHTIYRNFLSISAKNAFSAGVSSRPRACGAAAAGGTGLC